MFVEEVQISIICYRTSTTKKAHGACLRLQVQQSSESQQDRILLKALLWLPSIDDNVIVPYLGLAF